MTQLVKKWINIFNKDNGCLFEVLKRTIEATDLIGRETRHYRYIGFVHSVHNSLGRVTSQILLSLGS